MGRQALHAWRLELPVSSMESAEALPTTSSTSSEKGSPTDVSASALAGPSADSLNSSPGTACGCSVDDGSSTSLRPPLQRRSGVPDCAAHETRGRDGFASEPGCDSTENDCVAPLAQPQPRVMVFEAPLSADFLAALSALGFGSGAEVAELLAGRCG